MEGWCWQGQRPPKGRSRSGAGRLQRRPRLRCGFRLRALYAVSGTKWLQNGMEGAVHNSQSTVVLGEVHRSPPTLRRHGCRVLVLWTERTSNETADLSDFIVTT